MDKNTIIKQVSNILNTDKKDIENYVEIFEGKIIVNDNDISNKGVKSRKKLNLSYIPENRLGVGLAPARINGVALFSEELKLLTLPIESLNIKEKVSIGFLSCANKIIEPIINAIKNPAIKE